MNIDGIKTEWTGKKVHIFLDLFIFKSPNDVNFPLISEISVKQLD